MKRATALFAVCALAVVVAFGGSSRKPAAIDRDSDSQAPVVATSGTPSVMKTAAVTWVLVDSAQNVYGQGNLGSYAMWYDAPTNSLVLIHRGQSGYGASGQLWYNWSGDGGATWTRISELNAGSPNTNRYPSVAISNPTKSANLADALLVYGAPNLDNAGGFGCMSYGVDFPLGGASPVAFRDNADSSLGSNVLLVPAGASTYWAMDADLGLWRWQTTDFVSVTSNIPANLAFTAFSTETNDWGHAGGAYANGVSYIGYQARFLGTDTTAWPNFGYTKSTDGGATWGSWNFPTSIYSLLPSGDQARYTVDRVGTGISSEFVVDKDGYPHYMCVLLDTINNVPELVEVYQSASGWGLNKIKVGLNTATKLAYGGLDQTSWNVRASIDAAGEVIGLVWTDAATSAATDTLADLWFAARSLTSGWTTPENITQSPGLPELVVHTGRNLKSNGGGSYTIFLNVSSDPVTPTNPSDTRNPTYMWAGSHTFTAPTTGVGDEKGLPGSFTLEQNYPNPFNPSTRISYTIPASAFVSLKVYDLLGKEVATLVNEEMPAGSFNVEFNAANLANGAYFYKLQAGSFSDVKRMMLLK